MTAASLPPPDGPLDDDSFAGRLKGVLTRGRIQLKQVAAALGVSPSAVHKWTRGGEIEYPNLLALARFLNVNWLWLRYGDRALADLEANLNTDARAREGRQKHLAAIMESEARMTFAQEISGVGVEPADGCRRLLAECRAAVRPADPHAGRFLAVRRPRRRARRAGRHRAEPGRRRRLRPRIPHHAGT
jgi:transcriptional regulator with XRE-family HTH domain